MKIIKSLFSEGNTLSNYKKHTILINNVDFLDNPACKSESMDKFVRGHFLIAMLCFFKYFICHSSNMNFFIYFQTTAI